MRARRSNLLQKISESRENEARTASSDRSKLKNGGVHSGQTTATTSEISSTQNPEDRDSQETHRRSDDKTLQHEQEHEDNFSDWDSWNPMSEDYYSTKNTLALNPDKDPECVITGQTMPISTGFGKISICNHYEKYGTCADGQYCDRLHVKESSKEQVLALQRYYETNKGRTCLTLADLSPIELQADPNLNSLVVVTSAESPRSFYLVAPYDNMNFSNYEQADIKFYIERISQSSSVKTRLDKIHEQLAAIFGHNYRVDNVEDYIYDGQIVACKLKDGRFHRAVVTDFVADELSYKLRLIDVGVEVMLPRERLYDIRAHSLVNPPMAMHCQLKVKPPKNKTEWLGETLEYFENKLTDKRHWLCKILSHQEEDSIFNVDLIDLETRTSLTDSFVQRGLADHSQL